MQAALQRCMARLGCNLRGAQGGAAAGAGASAEEEEEARVRQCVDDLLRAATSVDNLARMFEGWQAWL